VSHDDFEVDSVEGVPGKLPAGETLLWQGKPAWRSLAVTALHVRKVALYFAVLVAWTVVDGLRAGQPAGTLAGPLLALALSAALAIGILCGLAALIARTTIYSITSARIVLRIGVALPMSVNLPFRVVRSAALRQRRDGTGDILIDLEQGHRVGYAVLWPHVRPWRFARAQPLLRCLPDAAPAADLLGKALASAAPNAAPDLVAPAAPAAPASVDASRRGTAVVA
jgi:hypothetical protein